MGPAFQVKVEAALDAPVRIEAAQRPTVDPRALWDLMDAHGYSQNETARLVGISSAHPLSFSLYQRYEYAVDPSPPFGQ